MRLDTPINKLPLVGPVYVRRLKKLDIETIEDLLLHVPHRYIDYRIISEIVRVQIGEIVTIHAKVDTLKNIYTKHGKKIQLAQIIDATGTMSVVWFNQPYLVRNIRKGELYSFSGKCDWFDRKKSLVSPDYENIENTPVTIHTGRLVPVYPETSRVSSKWLRGKMVYAFQNVKHALADFLPESVLMAYSFPTLTEAIEFVHFPKEEGDAEKGRARLAFDEVLFFQIKSLYRKKDWNENKVAHKLSVDKNILKEFINSLPFNLTASQLKSIGEIYDDLGNVSPMNRLLEGDVGSGKTVVAAAASFAAFINGYQSVVMAPTQILAQQHYDTLRSIFDRFKVRVCLVTSAGVKADLGKNDIFVGTHALIHKHNLPLHGKSVEFENVALVVIDEQHRFGVEQRAHLVKKGKKGGIAPHVLTMTATPIPRTIALTVYGDLNLSTLAELPKGRKPITTWLVPPRKREAAYGWIGEQIKKENIQVFFICPLIEESQVETMKQVKAATVEFERLKDIFSDFSLGLLHGRQTAKVKNDVLQSFKEGKTHILIATPVVEVGIDVPNATIMLVEGAERFGLAQLHQLRGRIGRGKKKSYCLLFTESKSPRVLSRLGALQKTLSGFELAELDLQLRGPGEMYGTKQHGFPQLKIASWSDTNLIKKARKVAEEAIENPQKYLKLIDKVKTQDVVPN